MKWCGESAQLLVPDFVKIINNELFLVEQNMGDGQAKALGDYLKYNSPSEAAKRSGWRITDK